MLYLAQYFRNHYLDVLERQTTFPAMFVYCSLHDINTKHMRPDTEIKVQISEYSLP